MPASAFSRAALSLLAITLLLAVSVRGDKDGQCGLRPPAEGVHPSDLNADGTTSPEEFVEYAKGQEEAKGEGMDKNGDGEVSTAEFVEFAKKQANGPVELTLENFDQVTGGSKAVFIKFMAPWCGHCKQMAKPWSDLAVKVHSEYSGLTVGTVNCDTQNEFCQALGIQGLPTILLLKNPEYFEDPAPVLYEDDRSYEALFGYLQQKDVLVKK
mmetsp:Transcript_51794/g.126344  ORF Transcript_51794/g.126344 Transcript_51794/m.126344 type:complete len:212 (+) Transcript_51794:91-726(+)